MVNPLCPLAIPFVVVVCLGPAPFLLSGLLFSFDEAQIWLGDLRSSWFLALVCLLVDLDLPAFMDQPCPCTNVFLTAYSLVRTEPLSDIGQARGKKKPPVSPLILFSPLSLRHGVVVVCFEVPG